ncbi:lysozyme-like protein 4 isoform X1 [Pongo pygmaeus]|uniref:lysozyme-like protein 4 isoform X1 n=1 Tax=Pongo pygmaeus TaxID=9600 RepID=UPI00300D2F8F
MILPLQGWGRISQFTVQPPHITMWGLWNEVGADVGTRMEEAPVFKPGCDEDSTGDVQKPSESCPWQRWQTQRLQGAGPPGPGTASTPTPWRSGWMVASCSRLHGPCSTHQLHLVNAGAFLLAASVNPVDDLTTLRAPDGKRQKFASSGDAGCRINQTSYSTWAKGLCFDCDYFCNHHYLLLL